MQSQKGFTPIQIVLSILAGTVILGGVVGGVLYFAEKYNSMTNHNSVYICSFSGYKKIKNGMTKDEVNNIVGAPLNIIDYSNIDRHVDKLWEYNYNGVDQFSTSKGNFNVMFNDKGIVISKSCGPV